MRAFAKVAVFSVVGLGFAGCAVPPAVTIASFVADGASFVSSGKTVTDHGISAIFDEDCALIRIFDGEVCRETPEYETAVAVLQPLDADPTDPSLAAYGPGPTVLASAAPVGPVSVEAVPQDAPAAVRPVAIPEPVVVVERLPVPAPHRKPHTMTVASGTVSPPMTLGLDPLRGLKFQRDATMPDVPMHISFDPAGPRLTDLAGTALAGLQARASTIGVDG